MPISCAVAARAPERTSAAASEKSTGPIDRRMEDHLQLRYVGEAFITGKPRRIKPQALSPQAPRRYNRAAMSSPRLPMIDHSRYERALRMASAAREPGDARVTPVEPGRL